MSCKLNVMNGQSNSYKIIINDYIKILETKIRNKDTESEELKITLKELGNIVGQELSTDILSKRISIDTPMSDKFDGLCIDFNNEIVIISTKDDYEYFANGIADLFGECIRGFIDFGSNRGQDVFTSPIRSIQLPDIISGRKVGTLIIAKSVLATGCTAISLAKKASEKYMPQKLIIVSAFCSERGICELKQQLPLADVYVCIKPETLDKNGMLRPGVGNIDARLNNKITY